MEDIMSNKSFAAPACAGALLLLAQTAVDAAEIRVLSSVAMRPAFIELVPQFERATGHKLALKLMASPAVARAIEAGETFDVAISNPGIVDNLIGSGKVIAGTRANIARSPIGIVAAAGSPKLDVESTEGFKRTLLNAKSVGHSDGGVGTHFLKILDRLGITAAMQGKLKVVPAMTGAEAVARGEVELAVIATVGVPGVHGVELVGVIPSELQSYIEFAGGVGTGAKEPEAALAWIKFLAAPESTAVIKAKGMERIASQ
jgi:molybdate transport system substrate-binding protein